MQKKGRVPSPVAACGAVLVALALAGLARGYDLTHAAPRSATASARDAHEPADRGASQADRLLEHRLLDVNRASAEELQLLPRIGPTLAARIVEERERGGPFRSVHDMTRVRGIGPRTIERLLPLATAGPRDAGVP